jgi:hypothetical protein
MDRTIIEIENAIPPLITNLVFLNLSSRAEPIAPDSDPIEIKVHINPKLAGPNPNS